MSAPVIIWGTLVIVTLAVFAALSFKIIVRGWGELLEMIRTLKSDTAGRNAPGDEETPESSGPTEGPDEGRPI
jgi:hypothetical protein